MRKVSRAFKGAVSLLRTCANARTGEQVLIVTDSATNPAVTKTIMAAALELGIEATKMTMKAQALPGDEPSPPVVAAMLSADIVICPTSRTYRNRLTRSSRQIS